MRDNIRRHPRAGIGDAERNLPGRQLPLPCRLFIEPLVGRLDGDATSLRHGVMTVDAKIKERAFKLIWVDLRRPKSTSTNNFDCDTGTDAAPDQVFHSADQSVDIDWFGVERLPPREGKQPLSECRGPTGCILRTRDITLHVADASLSEAPLKQFKASTYTGQKIVEIVRDAPCQLADRFHLLGLDECLFCTFEFARAFFDTLLQALVKLFELLLCPMSLDRIETFNEDTRYLIIFIENRLIYKI